jgi:type VI secretion system secreted protein VgrG
MRLDAALNTHFTAGQDVTITAQRKIILVAGDGTFMTLGGGKLELGSSGPAIVHGADHKFLGPMSAAALRKTLSSGPEALEPNWIEISHYDSASSAFAGQGYKIHFSGGEVIAGRLDEQGRAYHESVPLQAMRVEFEPLEPKEEDPWASLDSMLKATQQKLP